MGGSLALALKSQHRCREVVGLVRRAESVTEALSQGVVHRATTSPAEALSEANIVVFATPVRIILRQLVDYAALFAPDAIITDMGSTKQTILDAMATLPDSMQPVGSHPMCGKEQAGLAAAEATLYHNAPWIISPLARTSAQTVEVIKRLAVAVGAVPHIIEASRHDKLVAAASHLPYTLAATLTLAAQQVAADDPDVWNVAASGFRDTSRVAASDVTMMLDILLTNRAAISQMLNLAHHQLEQFAQALADKDETALRTMMERAAQQRRKLFQ